MRNDDLKIGARFERHDRLYRVAGFRQARTRDRGVIDMVTLRSTCCHCHNPFKAHATLRSVLRGAYLVQTCVQHRSAAARNWRLLPLQRPAEKRLTPWQQRLLERIATTLAAERPRRWHSSRCIAEQLGISAPTLRSALQVAFAAGTRVAWSKGKGGIVRRLHRHRWCYAFTSTRSRPTTPWFQDHLRQRGCVTDKRITCQAQRAVTRQRSRPAIEPVAREADLAPEYSVPF